MLMFRSGSSMASVESRMFWVMLVLSPRVIPMLEKVVLQFTDDVRVDCVIACGLYIEVRLLRSKLVVAKLTLAENELLGFALES